MVCAFGWKELLLAAAAVAEYGQLHGASSEAHRFARRRCPDINAFAPHEAACVCHQILTTVRPGFEPHARTQRQVSRIGSNQSLGDRLSARSPSAKTVGRGDVIRRRHNIRLCRCDLFSYAAFWRNDWLLWFLRRESLRRESCGGKSQRETQKCNSNDRTSAEVIINFQIRVSCPMLLLTLQRPARVRSFL